MDDTGLPSSEGGPFCVSHNRRKETGVALLVQQQARLGAYTPPYVLIDIQEA